MQAWENHDGPAVISIDIYPYNNEKKQTFRIDFATNTMVMTNDKGIEYKGGVRFGTYFATVVPFYIWSDGFEPNNSRKDVKNVWIMIISIAPPPGNMFHPDYVYIYAVQQTRNGTAKFDPALAYSTLAQDVRKMGTKFVHVRAIDGIEENKHKVMIPMRLMPAAVPVDSPERTALLGLSLCHASKFHRLYLIACNLQANVCNCMLQAMVLMYKQLAFDGVLTPAQLKTKIQFAAVEIEWYQERKNWKQALFTMVDTTYSKDLLMYFVPPIDKYTYMQIEAPTVLVRYFLHLMSSTFLPAPENPSIVIFYLFTVDSTSDV